MAKGKLGRPPREDGDKKSKLMRVSLEMAAKIEDLAELFRVNSADIITRVGQNDLNELHEAHKEQIAKMRAADEAKKKAQQEAIELQRKMEDTPAQPAAKPVPKKKPKGGS